MNHNLYLLLDVSSLAHRALHTVSDLRHPENPDQYTGVHYQLLQTCERLAAQFATRNLAFFFDSRESLRREKYPGYKAKRELDRKKESAKLQDQRQGMYEQVNALPKLLKQMGVVNVFGQTGYEADDLIAEATRTNTDKRLIIIGRDQDLYQVLAPHVSMYDVTNKTRYCEDDFTAEWGMVPSQWASVKAWAGCTSDSIIGLPKVGEKTAAKYLKNELNTSHKVYESFAQNTHVYNTNIELVRLPYPGTRAIELKPQVPLIKWSILADHIGSTTYMIGHDDE
jgi:DNA polymerase-1